MIDKRKDLEINQQAHPESSHSTRSQEHSIVLDNSHRRMELRAHSLSPVPLGDRRPVDVHPEVLVSNSLYQKNVEEFLRKRGRSRNKVLVTKLHISPLFLSSSLTISVFYLLE